VWFVANKKEKILKLTHMFLTTLQVAYYKVSDTMNFGAWHLCVTFGAWHQCVTDIWRADAVAHYMFEKKV